MNQTFGNLIRQARRQKEYTQRELAKLVGVDYTYLSKLENDRAGYPPSEEVIHELALHLGLEENELRRRAGRITPEDAKVFEDLVRQYAQMPALLRRMRDDPEFAKKLLRSHCDLGVSRQSAQRGEPPHAAGSPSGEASAVLGFPQVEQLASNGADNQSGSEEKES